MLPPSPPSPLAAALSPPRPSPPHRCRSRPSPLPSPLLVATDALAALALAAMVAAAVTALAAAAAAAALPPESAPAELPLGGAAESTPTRARRAPLPLLCLTLEGFVARTIHTLVARLSGP